MLPTLAEDASHGGYLAGGISASYTDLGANGQPALTTQDQNIVQLRRQEVEFAAGVVAAAVHARRRSGSDAGLDSHVDRLGREHVLGDHHGRADRARTVS